MSTKRLPIDFNSGFSKAVADSAKVWAHDRSTTVGASEVFGCMRSTFLKKFHPELADNAEEVDPEWGHTERGNLIENEFAVPSLKSMFGEDKCFYMGEDQKTFVDGHLSATPDGVVVDLPADALVNYGVDDIKGTEIATEIKTFGGEHAAPKSYRDDKGVIRYMPKPRHEGQNIVQMGIMQKVTNYKPKTGVVLYINPVNLKDIRVAPVKFDPNIYEFALKRAKAIFEPGKEAKDFAPEGLRTGQDCQYCPFAHICHDIEMKAYPDQILKYDEVDEAEREKIAALAKETAKLRADIKTIETKKKEVEADLKTALFTAGTTRLAGDDWSVSISKNAGRMSLDKNAMIEAGLDPEDYMKQGNEYYVMRVKG